MTAHKNESVVGSAENPVIVTTENGKVTLQMTPHLEVLLRANRMYESKNRQYHNIWKHYGWRGCLVHMRTCAERAFKQLWSAEPGSASKVDNLIDLINYAVFALRNIDEGNRDGTWGYD